MNDRWKQKSKPASLEARFEFDSFEILREFLDQTAEIAEQLEHHPNISFSKQHVSMIIYAKTGELMDIDFELQSSFDKVYDSLVTTTS
ncbi:4a-hydroxytetrahydrobiopterin dehydratase [Thiomicrorhabdus sediminis]|uniref:4a-hydroxytetrahydrobiopterin dehydratase n=1 Tax=Thiomicrorhabdus sediminis TaxID=2580412 RepID=UPI001EE7E8FE|nr:4a-hydroxytetrahydrobiopterin dehydratase [Thiomicrorhabdus sediminis]